MVKEFITNAMQPFKSSLVYKSAKDGQKSFRVTQQLLQSVYYKAKKLKTVACLVIRIPANKKENYILSCSVKKEKK